VKSILNEDAAREAAERAKREEEKKVSGKEWTTDELAALAKGIAKYPPGVYNRWEVGSTLM
jgi:hypothetical protein